jgi:hypothetical protein
MTHNEVRREFHLGGPKARPRGRSNRIPRRRVGRGLRFDLNFIYVCRGLQWVAVTVPSRPSSSWNSPISWLHRAAEAARGGDGPAYGGPISDIGRVLWAVTPAHTSGRALPSVPWDQFAGEPACRSAERQSRPVGVGGCSEPLPAAPIGQDAVVSFHLATTSCSPHSS